MKTIKLNDKLKYIKKVLKTPYHFFYITSTGQTTVVFEDKYGKRYTYGGNGMYNAVIVAEEYVKAEVESGSLIEPKELRDEDTSTETSNKQDENENK